MPAYLWFLRVLIATTLLLHNWSLLFSEDFESGWIQLWGKESHLEVNQRLRRGFTVHRAWHLSPFCTSIWPASRKSLMAANQCDRLASRQRCWALVWDQGRPLQQILRHSCFYWAALFYCAPERNSALRFGVLAGNVELHIWSESCFNTALYLYDKRESFHLSISSLLSTCLHRRARPKCSPYWRAWIPSRMMWRSMLFWRGRRWSMWPGPWVISCSAL